MRRAALAEALSLVERLPLGEVSDLDEYDATEKRWRGVQLAQLESFSLYLHQLGFTRKGLAWIIAGHPWQPRTRTLAWVETAEALLSFRSELQTYRPTPDQLVIEGTSFRKLPFDGILGDILEFHCTAMDEHPHAHLLAPEGKADLLDALASRVGSASIRCLLAELAAQRRNGLEGDTPEQRYESFNRSLQCPRARVAFAEKYPGFARDLVHISAQWTRLVSDILTRFDADCSALHKSELLGQEATSITRINLSAGDRHDGGQTVAILTVNTGQKVVYKPRDSEIYEFYSTIVKELFTRPKQTLSARAPRAILRGGYGWIEFIDHASAAETVVDLDRYLRNLGVGVAVAYVLGAGDLHLENVIAAQAGPVPIDLETVIQNRTRRQLSTLANERAIERLNNSVLGAGYLPVRVGQEDRGGIDVSVLTGGLVAAADRESLRIVDAFTDSMRVEQATGTVGQSQNQPDGMTLDYVRLNAALIAEGFEEAYKTALAHKPALLNTVDRAKNFKFRHLLRATRTYSLLLHEATQPGYLQSGLAKDHLFSKLWRYADENPGDAAAIAEEQRSLHLHDVPIFAGELDSRALYVEERVVSPDYFGLTGRESLRQRIESLSMDDLGFQRSVILESVAGATAQPVSADSVPQFVPSELMHVPDEQDPKDYFAKVLHRLKKNSIVGDSDATWIGVCAGTGNDGFEYRPLGTTLYDGLAGVGFCLTYASTLTQQTWVKELAQRTLSPVHANLVDWLEDAAPIPLGGFSGVSGMLYAINHYRSVTGDHNWDETYDAVLRKLPSAIGDDRYLDITAGAAGVCATLAGDLTLRTSKDLVACIRTAATHLIDTSQMLPNGSRAWAVGDEKVLLGGFSHGATGIGWALARAGEFLQDTDILQAARQALSFDDLLYDSTTKRWADARPEMRKLAGRQYPVHWCHGAAGISMARLSAGSILQDEELLASGAEAAEIVFHAGLPKDDSLCHGGFGSWEALQNATVFAPGRAAIYASALLGRISTSGELPGLPEGIVTVPGLMLGWSGTLLTLCRMISPDTIPSVLLLEPPVAKRELDV